MRNQDPDGPDRKESNNEFFLRMQKMNLGIGQIHSISPDESLNYEDRIFIAKPWKRSYQYSDKEREYICKVAEFPELIVLVSEYHHIEKEVNKELLRLRDVRLREGKPIPEPDNNPGGPSRTA